MGVMETLPNDQTTPYFSSQRSLQSVPSLTSSNSNPDDHDDHHHHHHCLVHSFTAHSAPISSIAVCGDLVFTGSAAREIGSWSGSFATTNAGNANNFTFAAGQGAVKWLAVAGARLFSAHQDHKIRVWRIEDCGKTSTNKSAGYARVATLPTLGDRAAKLLTPGSRVAVRRHKSSTWVHHVDAVSALALSPDESLLYSVSWDRALKVWRTADFRCLESVRDAHDDAINAVAASPDGHVYTGSADKKIKVWRTSAQRPKKNYCSTSTGSTGTTGDTSSGSATSAGTIFVAALEKHNSGVNALAISSDGSVLYSGAGDRSVVVWEKAKDGEGNHCMVVLGALRGHSKAILCLAVVKDFLVCSGSADKTVRVWRGVERRYSCLAVLRGHSGPVKCLTAVIEKNYDDDDDHDDGDEASCLVYSGGLDCEVKVWKIIVPDDSL